MLKEWVFKVFISYDAEGKPINEINNWLESLDIPMKVRVKTVIAHLETQKDMRCKWFASWRTHKYIYRIKFRKQNRLYRLFGCYGPKENEFTLLIPVNKIAGRLEPRNGVEIAEKRRELIFQDRRHIDDFI